MASESTTQVSEVPGDEGTATGGGVRITPAPFVAGGTPIDVIAVGINLGIIERFSEGLYATPIKAFEELVTNSYDAGAGRVWLDLPPELTNETAIAVVDDGVSMDIEGLRDLWQIGVSTKRDRPPPDPDRDPVGQFGIGKLSTYVLAHSLTFVCKRGETYLATTMDFSKVRGWFSDAQGVTLEVVELDAEHARSALERVLTNTPAVEVLFGDEPPKNWTAAILTDLKDRAFTLHRPSLHWVMSSALPLNPKFTLWINKKQMTSSKASGKDVWKWRVGPSDIAASNAYADAATPLGVSLPAAGLVTGTATLYALPLPRGISEGVGRSHGFFVTVRHRLVNIDENDPSFGIKEELKHGVLTRFHMEVNVDGLDKEVTATRESVKESPALEQVRRYLLAVFNQARKEWEAFDKADDATLSAGERIARPPEALSQGPLRRALAQMADGDDRDELLAELVSLPDAGPDALPPLDSAENLLVGIVQEDRGIDNRISFYDAERRVIVVNSSHPFIDNYSQVKAAREPLQLIAATELLTGLYLLDEDVPRDVIRDVLDRRDAYLRALVDIYPRSATVIAQKLREAVVDEKQLEDAVADAMDYLGYFVKRRSGSNKTDVVAWALLGPRSSTGDSETYGVVCDAKSSSVRDVIKADKVNPGPLHKHKRQERADFILVVAPGFEGASDDESSIAEYCTTGKITPIEARDLARIVELYPTKVINPASVRSLFDCHTPKASKAYVDDLVATAPARPYPPIDLILGIIQERSKGRSPVSVDTLIGLIAERTEGKLEYSTKEMSAVTEGLHALAPTTFWHNNRFVALQTTPEKVKAEILESLANLPSATADAALRALETG